MAGMGSPSGFLKVDWAQDESRTNHNIH
jgi:hypothetical protein